MRLFFYPFILSLAACGSIGANLNPGTSAQVSASSLNKELIAAKHEGYNNVYLGAFFEPDTKLYHTMETVRKKHQFINPVAAKITTDKRFFM
jgi:hypothetical protein